MTNRSTQARQRRADALATYLEPVFSRLRLDGRPEEPGQLHHWLADVIATQDAEGDALYDQYASTALQPPHRSAHHEGRPQRALTW